MKCPPTFLVGPHEVRVEFDKAAIDDLSNREKVDLHGRWEPLDNLILIRPDMDRSYEAETVLHEVLHTITSQIGADNLLTDEAEEQLVGAISPVLLDVLRRNPELVEYLVVV